MQTPMKLIILACLVVGSQAWSNIPNRFIKRRIPETILKLSNSPQSSNVVFRPSTDPEAFDSAKIGSVSIHRYPRSAGDSEYVMWYHGRSTNFDSSNELPPLSTGRIGRATSRNGLLWERNEVGSESEDVRGVCLGLNKEGWWGFDTAHVGLGQVMLPMSTPAISAEGGVYLMYYMGGSLEEKPIGEYMENATPEVASTMIKGMNMKIGVALSQDGITFGRVEGDDPTGAIMAPYDASDPNMKEMESMRDDDNSPLHLQEELYCAWPEVVVNSMSEKERKKTNSKGFFMYYSTMLKETKEKLIGVAVSDDGFRWFKRGLCLQPSADSFDDGGCARCNVIRNAVFDEEKGEWEETKGWTMFYEGVSKKDGKHRILTAESFDGRKWEKKGLTLDIGKGDEAWDCNGVGSAHVVRLDDGSTRMYYTGQGNDGATAIGVAMHAGDSAGDEVTFVRENINFQI